MAKKAVFFKTVYADRLAADWRRARALLVSAQEDLAELERHIASAVRQQGHLATKAKFMRVLDGLEWQLQLIARHSVDVNAAAAEAFCRACPRSLRGRLLRRETRFVQAPGAEILLDDARITDRLLKLYFSAVHVRRQKDSVKVVRLKRAAQKKAA